MRYRLKFLHVIILIGLSINAQKNTDEIHIRDLNSKSVEVNFKGKIYNYDFIFPEAMSIDSYFVSTTNDTFYVKYEYTGSATSKYFVMVGFKWKKGNIYLIEYVLMNNQKGKWTGIARIINEKLVENYEDIESVITSFETKSEIHVIRNSKSIGKIRIPKKIASELVIDDKIFFEILNEVKKI